MNRQTLKHHILTTVHSCLLTMVREMGYELEHMHGAGGFHRSNGYSKFTILIGVDQSLEDKVITISHEVGHALDCVRYPLSILERRAYHNNVVNGDIISREAMAWQLGRQVLGDMGYFDLVEKRFIVLRKEGMDSYVKLLGKRTIINIHH